MSKTILNFLLFIIFCHATVYNIQHQTNSIMKESCLYMDSPCVFPESTNNINFNDGYLVYASYNCNTVAKMLINIENDQTIYINTNKQNVMLIDAAYYTINNNNVYTCTLNDGCCYGNPCNTNNNVFIEWDFNTKIVNMVYKNDNINLQISYMNYNSTYGGIEFDLLGTFNDYFNIYQVCF